MQMMVLRSSLLLGENVEGSDRYEDWRLDVENMTYEVRAFLPLTWMDQFCNKVFSRIC